MADHTKRVWEKGAWRTEALTEADEELLRRPMQPEKPVFYEEFGKWSNDIGQMVPSDFGKLRKLYGDELAERIEIEDDLAAYNRGDDY